MMRLFSQLQRADIQCLLQGGQAQRVVLAICLALKPSILLLDEPTASLDTQSALQVERVLRACGAALVWVTHDDAQPSRVGGRVLQLPLGTEVRARPVAWRGRSQATGHQCCDLSMRP